MSLSGVHVPGALGMLLSPWSKGSSGCSVQNQPCCHLRPQNGIPPHPSVCSWPLARCSSSVQQPQAHLTCLQCHFLQTVSWRLTQWPKYLLFLLSFWDLCSSSGNEEQGQHSNSFCFRKFLSLGQNLAIPKACSRFLWDERSWSDCPVEIHHILPIKYLNSQLHWFNWHKKPNQVQTRSCKTAGKGKFRTL